jgi:branched-chain amino acid transport system permease protein
MAGIDIRRSINIGLLFGVIALSISAIGMVETFDEKDIITDVLSLGQLLLYSAPILAGYVVARPKEGEYKAGSALVSGFLAGLMVALPLVGLIILSVLWPGIREALVNVSPTLIEILTFGQGPLVGSLILILVMAILGLLGAAFHLLPIRIERPVVIGLAVMVTLGLFSEVLLFLPFIQAIPRAIARFLFGQSGLQPFTALIVFVVATLLAYWWQERGKESFQKRRMSRTETQMTNQRRIGLVVIVILLLTLPFITGTYITNVVDRVGIFILMGLGLNIVVGYAGLLDLGYVAFFAIGAYVMGLLTSTGDLGLGLSFWIAIPFSVLAAAMAGILLGIPVLRMRGDYLAIVTLGFGEIIRVLVRSDLLKPLIGGAQGIILIGKPTLPIIGSLISPENYYYLILIGCAVALFVSMRLRDSRPGRRWMAMREDEDVAEAMGIHLVSSKLLAFAFGAALGGLAGGIFASQIGSIFPASFELLVSIQVLSLIIVGGIGSLPGVVVGAAVLIGLPELLREFSEYRQLIYGALLIAMMVLKPEGLWPSPVRRRELHAEEDIAIHEGPMHEDVHDLV